MKSVITILMLLMTASQILAQQTQRLHTISVESEALDQERSLKIYLPEGYTEDQSYPVVYTTDAGSSNFEAAQNYMEVLSNPSYNVMPTSILVGIVHPEGYRNKDLDVFGQESGKHFMRHLIDEVVPYIDSNYNTSGFNAMIGHSNGAEYNHFLMLAEDNPFRGFISMSTSFNTDVRSEIAEFFKNYEGPGMYYFIANATLDSPERPEAGNEIASLYESSANERIKLNAKTYNANHMSIVAHSLLEGLKFVYQDYNNIQKYESIRDYAENYLVDLKDNYGIKGSYEESVVMGDYLFDIIMNKKTEEYEYWAEFVNENKLARNGTIDYMNRTNQYYVLGSYSKAIEYMNKAADSIDTVEDIFFFNYLNRIKKAYDQEDRLPEYLDLLKKGREVLPEKYTLQMNYKIARFTINHGISVEEGKEALEYCKNNFTENSSFNRDHLNALTKKLDSSTTETK